MRPPQVAELLKHLPPMPENMPPLAEVLKAVQTMIPKDTIAALAAGANALAAGAPAAAAAPAARHLLQVRGDMSALLLGGGGGGLLSEQQSMQAAAQSLVRSLGSAAGVLAGQPAGDFVGNMGGFQIRSAGDGVGYDFTLVDDMMGPLDGPEAQGLALAASLGIGAANTVQQPGNVWPGSWPAAAVAQPSQLPLSGSSQQTLAAAQQQYAALTQQQGQGAALLPQPFASGSSNTYHAQAGGVAAAALEAGNLVAGMQQQQQQQQLPTMAPGTAQGYIAQSTTGPAAPAVMYFDTAGNASPYPLHQVSNTPTGAAALTMAPSGMMMMAAGTGGADVTGTHIHVGSWPPQKTSRGPVSQQQQQQGRQQQGRASGGGPARPLIGLLARGRAAVVGQAGSKITTADAPGACGACNAHSSTLNTRTTTLQ